jgi:hypothetical protein
MENVINDYFMALNSIGWEYIVRIKKNGAFDVLTKNIDCGREKVGEEGFMLRGYHFIYE